MSSTATVEAQLQVRTAGGDLVDLEVNGDGQLPVVDPGARTLLAAVVGAVEALDLDVDTSALATDATAVSIVEALAGTLTVDTQLQQALTADQLAADRDTVLEVLPAQTGPGVLEFTFDGESTPWVHADGTGTVRATTTQTPTDTLGVPVPAGSPFPLPVVTEVVRVFVADGAAVTVYGTR